MTDVATKLHAIVLRTHSTCVDGELAADRGMQLICAALGLPGEAGEFAEAVKKTVEQDREFDRAKAIKELGDVAYYLQLACMALDVTLPEVVAALELKLLARYPRGFSPQDSLSRKDEWVHDAEGGVPQGFSSAAAEARADVAEPESVTDGGAGS